MNIVLFSNLEKDIFSISSNDNRFKHVLNILHKKEGDSFSAGIENGKAGIATIVSLNETEMTCSFVAKSDGKPLYPLEMIIGFPRPIQLKRLFRDLAGLGVSKIHLCGTELGEKSYMQSKIVERGSAHNLLRDGTIQAKSTHIPELLTYKSLRECLGVIAGNDALKICLDNVDARESLSSFVRDKKKDIPCFAAIGSERGWSENERGLFEKEGFLRCSMGERVLRTETAATVAATIILENSYNIL